MVHNFVTSASLEPRLVPGTDKMSWRSKKYIYMRTWGPLAEASPLISLIDPSSSSSLSGMYSAMTREALRGGYSGRGAGGGGGGSVHVDRP